jgi:hypothetical protein
MQTENMGTLYILHNTTEQFGMEISPIMCKVMEFKGQLTLRSNTVILNTILKRINTFIYLVCNVLDEEEKDIKNVLTPNLVQRQSRLKVYNILAIPSLLYGCEI